MQIIDAHTHVFPDKIAVKSSASIGHFYDLHAFSDASLASLRKTGEEIGVCHRLVCSTAVVPEQTTHINDYMASLRDQPDLTPLGTLHPAFSDWEPELERIVQLGLAGVKLHPDFQAFDIDDPVMLPIYRRIAALHLPLLIHMGDPRYTHSHPDRLARVLDQVPGLTVIAAHFGGYCRWDAALRLPVLPNLYFDTSSSLMLLGHDDAHAMLERFGIDHFMFGTDFPIWDPKEELDRVLSLGLPKQDYRQLFSGTFRSLFPNEKIFEKPLDKCASSAV